MSLDYTRLYFIYMGGAALTVAAAGSLLVPGYVRRGLRSWWTGATSGLVFLSFVILLSALLYPSHALRYRLAFAVAGIVGSFFLSAALHLSAKVRAEQTISEQEFEVPERLRKIAGTQLSESDDPIRNWKEDSLGRAALVDSISLKVLVAKSPVILLSGDFGSGKTSILNLLREHLGDKTITVAFSTWLPGSEETLSSYLLNDIANECKKQYVVPGLRKSTTRLAAALGRSVPILKNYLELLPPTTQREDIDALKLALERLPKRVVVLLDELDRMDKEELVMLLKVIRGISTLPNVSFVCAGNRKTIVETVKVEDNDKNNAYFEKFFPVLIEVPNPDPTALRKAGTERLVEAFKRRKWFETDDEENKYRKNIDTLWNDLIAPFCLNLRSIGLFANDVSVAAALLRREVDAVDLTFVELLHRFKPDVYTFVSTNALALTGGEALTRGGPFLTEEDEKKQKKDFLEQLDALVTDGSDREHVRTVLQRLFPAVWSGTRSARSYRIQIESEKQKSDLRIQNVGIFPAYFRYEIPEAIFSSVELAAWQNSEIKAASEAVQEELFLSIVNSMPKGSLKRDDFFRKLAEVTAATIPVPTAVAIARAAMKAADQYVYDTLPGFGEAGRVLRFLLRVAHRLPQYEVVEFLSDCIRDAADDTMAWNILRVLTLQEGPDKLPVTIADLIPSFLERMRLRYGPDIDASRIDLSTSDPGALGYWGSGLKGSNTTPDPKDREMQHDFWRRYIGNDRKRLAYAFKTFFLPFGMYESDPMPLVEYKISQTDLRRLYEETSNVEPLTEEEQKSLARLKKLLDGEYKSGIDPFNDPHK